MSSRKIRKLLLLFAAFSLFAAACGSDDDDDAQEDADVQTTAAPDDSDDASDDDMSDDDMSDDDMSDDETHDEETHDKPGEGVSVTPARADWNTGYFQNEVIAELLRELGYEVADPGEKEQSATTGFLAQAQRDVDYWANSWIPGHKQYWDAELSDGSTIADNISIVGGLILGGSIQGLLIENNFADEYGITSMDEFNANAEAIAAYDAVDPEPGNGKADIYGCPESWVCDDVIASQIAFSGWENIDQVIAGYEAMIAEAVDKAASDTPFVVYTWGPSAYLTQIVPGQDAYWLTQDKVLDDSNPLGRETPPPDQRPGLLTLSEDVCPGAAKHPEGLCQNAFLANDIHVTANNDFLAENPAAAALLEAVALPAFDVSLAVVEQDDGADPKDLALAWIEDNRATVDEWLDQARQAA